MTDLWPDHGLWGREPGTILTCRDGRELVIAAATEKQYHQLMTCLGLADIVKEPRFSTGQLRVINRDVRVATIRTRSEQLRRVCSLVVGGEAVERHQPLVPPGLNQHVRTVLVELIGYSREEIAQLQAQGAFGSLDSPAKF